MSFVVRLGAAISALLALSEVVSAEEPPAVWDVPELIKQLCAEDPQTRGEAASRLREIGPEAKPAVPLLVKLLSDDDGYKSPFSIGLVMIYGDAFRALIDIGSESVAELTVALHDPSEDVRLRAAEALERIGPKARQALPDLLTMASDNDAGVRLRATHAIAAIDAQGDDAVPALLARLRDEDEDIRRVAAPALGRYKLHFQKIVPALIEALHDPEASVRGGAAQALGTLGRSPDTVVPALIALLDDQSGEYQECWLSANCAGCVSRHTVGDAARALAAFGEAARPAAPALFVLLDPERGTDWSAWGSCAWTFAQLGPAARPYVPKLVEQMQQRREHGLDRSRYLSLFQELGPNAMGAVPALRELMDAEPDEDSPEGETQIAAACALLAIDFAGNPRAWDRLLTELDGQRNAEDGTDEESTTSSMGLGLARECDTVFSALEALGGKAQAAVPKLARLLGSCDSIDGEGIIRALARIGSAAKDAVPQMIEHGSWYSWERDKTVAAICSIGPGAIPAIVQWLDANVPSDESYDGQCIGLLQTVAAIGTHDRSVAEAVERWTSDERPAVRAAAAGALARLRLAPETYVPRLVALLEDDRAIVRGHAASGLAEFKAGAKSAGPQLLNALGDPYIDLRVAAAEAVGEVGLDRETAGPALERLATDPSPLVRSAAQKSLAKLESLRGRPLRLK